MNASDGRKDFDNNMSDDDAGRGETYGWVDLDEQEILQDVLENLPPRATAAPKPQVRPTLPLLENLHVENFKSLAGPHEVPLAPLTLIYGPNAAGKSTILQALRIFAQAVKAGRHDALHIYDECFGIGGTRLWELVSENDLERTLVLGANLRTRGGGIACAELRFLQDMDADLVVQSSALGVNGGPSTTKTFHIDYSDLNTGAVEPWYSVGPDPDNLKRVRKDNELFALADDDLQDRLFDLAVHLLFLGPHRGDPKRVYQSSKESFRRDQENRDLANPSRVNAILRGLDVPYRFEAKDAGQALAGGNWWIGEWQLVDTRNNVKVRLDQVGYGVSQLLPVIESCMRSSDQVICIEQPELHLHPRLQAKLGNLFTWSALRGGNQIIAETHSENILLRVRKLIRQGKLKPTDVAVIYVDNNNDGAVIRRLRLGTRGELLDPWPTGFFDDSLNDVLGGWG